MTLKMQEMTPLQSPCHPTSDCWIWPERLAANGTLLIGGICMHDRRTHYYALSGAIERCSQDMLGISPEIWGRSYGYIIRDSDGRAVRLSVPMTGSFALLLLDGCEKTLSARERLRIRGIVEARIEAEAARPIDRVRQDALTLAWTNIRAGAVPTFPRLKRLLVNLGLSREAFLDGLLDAHARALVKKRETRLILLAGGKPVRSRYERGGAKIHP